MPQHLTLAVPPVRRVIALEDARDWLVTAVAELAKGDTAAAVHATHIARRHADEAFDELIPMLVWSELDDS